MEEGWYRQPLPVVEIKGREEPEKFVLLHGHYDSWDVGVGDNATGDATLLEIARVLWAHRDQLRRSVRIAWWPGHSTGRYAGSTWFADRFAIDLDENCVAQINCDSPGCRWASEFKDISWMSETEAYRQERDPRGHRPGRPWRAAAPRRRLRLQQHRHVELLHAQLDHAGRSARREGLLRGRRLRRQHRLAHRGRHARDRRPGQPGARHQGLSRPPCWASPMPRCCRSTGGRRWPSSAARSTGYQKAAGDRFDFVRRAAAAIDELDRRSPASTLRSRAARVAAAAANDGDHAPRAHPGAGQLHPRGPLPPRPGDAGAAAADARLGERARRVRRTTGSALRRPS